MSKTPRVCALTLLTILSLALAFFVPGSVAPFVSDFSLPPPPDPSSPPPAPPPSPPPPRRIEWDDENSLGVHVVSPMYAIVPVTQRGKKSVTVSMTIWLRRVGKAGGRYDLPHQSKDTIRIVVWVDDPSDLHNRDRGHVKLAINHRDWRPKIKLETAEPGPVLWPVLETGPKQLELVDSPEMRPYSFQVEIPNGVGNCFKLVEESYPKHKEPFCIPPPATDLVCTSLAPSTTYSAAKPALYIAVPPIRHAGSTRDWRRLHHHIISRVLNYVSYQTAMGATGVLLYADSITRQYLRRERSTADLMKQGQLRLINWDMHERAHENTDGRGRGLGYNFDQGLVANHVFLGLSACGTNVMVLFADMDEYIYFPKPGTRWPTPMGTCIPTQTSTNGEQSSDPISVHKLQRFDVFSSKVLPVDEWRLWTTQQAAPLSGAADNANGSSFTMTDHPLAMYDLAYRPTGDGDKLDKPVVLPAANIIAYYISDGVPLYGKVQMVHSSCMVLLHVPNAFRSRRAQVQEGSDKTLLRKFSHWLFAPKR